MAANGGTEQRFPSESVLLCAEPLVIHVAQAVTRTLVEDVSFRVRQIVDVSGGNYN